MQTRAELYELYKPLRDQGLTFQQIADRLGRKRSAVAGVVNDPDGLKQRKRRKRYQGTCSVCGIPTDGSNGRAKAPKYCEHHIGDNEGWISKLTKWPTEKIIVALQEWNEIYGEPPASPDWSPTHARYLGDEERAQRFERERGRWPHFTSVVYHFGSWNAGIEAAGFTPRQADGGGGNACRRRNVNCLESEEAPPK